MHLAIAGNIGSGKTTLTTLLAKHYRYTPHFEQVDDNPYLNDFYKDMTRWSFNLQVYFLKSRFAQLIEMKKKGKEAKTSHKHAKESRLRRPARRIVRKPARACGEDPQEPKNGQHEDALRNVVPAANRIRTRFEKGHSQ